MLRRLLNIPKGGEIPKIHLDHSLIWKVMNPQVSIPPREPSVNCCDFHPATGRELACDIILVVFYLARSESIIWY
jgi:hypothetical protein